MGKFKAKEKYKKTDTTGGGGEGIRRMKLIPGTNTIRIVEDGFEEAWVHHFQNAEGKNKRELCIGRAKCPICAASKKNKANHRFYFNVIDRKDQKATGKTVIKLLEVGKLIFEAIRDLALDEEYGDPTQYNLKIERKGEGKMDTKYSVRASTKIYDLKSSEKAVIAKDTEDGGAYDLSVFVTKKTKAELEAALTGEEVEVDEKDDSEEEEDDTEDTKPRKKDKKHKVKEADEDEDEDEDGDEDNEDDEELDIDKEIDDLEEDEEDEEEDDEEEEKPKKKSEKKKKVKKEEEDDEEEEEF